MGWTPTFIRQYKCICNQLARYTSMSENRVNKHILNYCKTKSGTRCQNWTFRVSKHFISLDCVNFVNVPQRFSSQYMFSFLSEKMFQGYVNEWHVRVSRIQVRGGRGGNKLRTYKLFKNLFQTEEYCKIILPPSHRSAFAKFRCGVAPLRLETGRYEGLPADERKCPFCRVHVEDEKHVLLQCQKAVNVRRNFYDLPDNEKLVFLFSDQNMIRDRAEACFTILQRRAAFLYKWFNAALYEF